DLVASNFRLSPNKITALAGDGKTPGLVTAIEGQAAADMIKAEHDFSTLDCHGTVLWAGVSNRFAISKVPGRRRQTFAHRHFVQRVDIVPFSNIDCDRHAGIGKLESCRLGFTQLRLAAFRWGGVGF